MGNTEITMKLSRLTSVFGIGDVHLEAATGDVMKKFIIFIGKHQCWSLFSINLQACNFIKKRLQHRCFPLNITKFLRTPSLAMLLSNHVNTRNTLQSRKFCRKVFNPGVFRLYKRG